MQRNDAVLNFENAVDEGVELGRVAEHWNVAELHQDMKWSAGAGLRLFVNQLLVRVDVGFSQEGHEVQMMVSHPFPDL